MERVETQMTDGVGEKRRWGVVTSGGANVFQPNGNIFGTT